MLWRDLFISSMECAVSAGIYYGVTVNQKTYTHTHTLQYVHVHTEHSSLPPLAVLMGGEDRGGEGVKRSRRKLFLEEDWGKKRRLTS